MNSTQVVGVNFVISHQKLRAGRCIVIRGCTANSAVPIEAFLWYFSKISRTYYARRWVREIVAQKYSISWVRLRFVQYSHIFRTCVREKIELCPT